LYQCWLLYVHSLIVLVACQKPKEEQKPQPPAEVTISTIAISRLPDKINYIVGEQFVQDGLEVEATMTDGTQKMLQESQYNVSVPSFSMAGTKTVTVSVVGSSNIAARFDVTVVERQISLVVLKTQPNKLAYVQGETFDPSGLSVQVLYNNSQSEIVEYNDVTKSDFRFVLGSLDIAEGYAFDKVLDTTIAVMYKGREAANGIKITVVSNDTINDLFGIPAVSVQTFPTKKDYLLGETFAPTGLEVSVVYNNSGSFRVKYNNVTKAHFRFVLHHFDQVGRGTVDVYYRDAITLNAVRVNLYQTDSIKTIAITKQANDCAFVVGESFEYDGLEITATLFDGSTKVLQDSEFAVTAPDMTTAGTKRVFVTVNGDGDRQFILSYDIRVNEPSTQVTFVVVTSNPTKTTYNIGEIFDPTGLTLVVRYNDGSQQLVEYNDGNKGDFTLRLAGKDVDDTTVLDSALSTTMSVYYKGRQSLIGVKITVQ